LGGREPFFQQERDNSPPPASRDVRELHPIVAALRQRTEDIPTLVWHFTALYGRRMNKSIDDVPPETMDARARYRWPGNVRELQNFVERAVILRSDMSLRFNWFLRGPSFAFSPARDSSNEL